MFYGNGRIVDIDLMSDALIRTNKIKLKRNYEFVLNKDRSYKCPICGQEFKPNNVRSNPHARRHYNLSICQSRKTLKQSYMVINKRTYKKGKRVHFYILSNVIKKILAFDEYRIHPVQKIISSMIDEKCNLYPQMNRYNFEPKFEMDKKLAISRLSTNSIKRSIDIPNINIYINKEYDNKIDNIIDDTVVFNNIDDVKPYIKNRIRFLLKHNFRSKEEILFFRAFNKSAENKRNINIKITKGMKEWIDLVDPGFKYQKEKTIGLLSK